MPSPDFTGLHHDFTVTSPDFTMTSPDFTGLHRTSPDFTTIKRREGCPPPTPPSHPSQERAVWRISASRDEGRGRVRGARRRRGRGAPGAQGQRAAARARPISDAHEAHARGDDRGRARGASGIRSASPRFRGCSRGCSDGGGDAGGCCAGGGRYRGSGQRAAGPVERGLERHVCNRSGVGGIERHAHHQGQPRERARRACDGPAGPVPPLRHVRTPRICEWAVDQHDAGRSDV